MTVDFTKAVEIQIYDQTSLLQVARIKAYELFRWTRNYYQNDSFEFRCRRGVAGCDCLTTSSMIAYYDGVQVHAGLIEEIQYDLKPNDEVIICKGRCVGSVFRERLALEGVSSGTGYDTQTSVDAESAMRHYVDVNCINASDASRNIADLVLATNQNRGATVTYSARFDVVHDILETIGYYAGLGWEVVFDRTAGKFTFTVLQGTDRSANVKFSPKFKNVKNLEYLESLLDSPTVAVVAGDGLDASRTIVTVTDTDATASRFSWRETFVDARDVSGNDELTLRGQSVLDEAGDGITIDVEVTNNTFLYLDDYDLGDIVTVVYPGVFELQSRIISITGQIDTSGRTLEITVGTSANDIVKLVRLASKPTQGARQ